MTEFAIKKRISGVDIIAAHADVNTLKRSRAQTRVQISNRGIGCGLRPNIARMLAEESTERISESLLGASVAIIFAGLGSGTGTGASPVIAQVAKRLGAFTIAVVTTPFLYEGRRQHRIADLGIDELSKVADLLFVLSNRKMEALDGDLSFLEWLEIADETLLATALSAIATVNPSDVTLPDLRGQYQILAGGIASANGTDRFNIALNKAFASPFFKCIDSTAVDLVLVAIDASNDLGKSELNTFMTIMQKHGFHNTLIRIGTRRLTNNDGVVMVSVAAFSKGIVSGLPPEERSAMSSVRTNNQKTTGEIYARNFVNGKWQK